jgi:hypothetical protein
VFYDAKGIEDFKTCADFIVNTMATPVGAPEIGVRKETIVFLAKCCVYWELSPYDELFAKYTQSQQKLIETYLDQIKHK